MVERCPGSRACVPAVSDNAAAPAPSPDAEGGAVGVGRGLVSGGTAVALSVAVCPSAVFAAARAVVPSLIRGGVE